MIEIRNEFFAYLNSLFFIFCKILTQIYFISATHTVALKEGNLVTAMNLLP